MQQPFVVTCHGLVLHVLCAVECFAFFVTVFAKIFLSLQLKLILITSVLNVGGAEETVLPAGDLQEKENAGKQPSSPEKAEL